MIIQLCKYKSQSYLIPISYFHNFKLEFPLGFQSLQYLPRRTDHISNAGDCLEVNNNIREEISGTKSDKAQNLVARSAKAKHLIKLQLYIYIGVEFLANRKKSPPFLIKDSLLAYRPTLSICPFACKWRLLNPSLAAICWYCTNHWCFDGWGSKWLLTR